MDPNPYESPQFRSEPAPRLTFGRLVLLVAIAVAVAWAIIRIWMATASLPFDQTSHSNDPTTQKTLHVDLELPQGLLKNLQLAEQARHSFVHTGGFVSKLITERLETEEYGVGDRFSVSLAYCQSVSEGILAFGHIAFEAIASKFWSATKSTVQCTDPAPAAPTVRPHTSPGQSETAQP